MRSSSRELNPLEKRVINLLQKDFGYGVNPYNYLAKTLEISVNELLEIINNLKDEGYITRIGPFYNMDKSNGYVSLVAMIIPDNDFENVTNIVNSYFEVAHNYQRDNKFNMWFVLASESKERSLEILCEIEKVTGYKTYNLPKLKEYALSLYLEV